MKKTKFFFMKYRLKLTDQNIPAANAPVRCLSRQHLQLLQAADLAGSTNYASLAVTGFQGK